MFTGSPYYIDHQLQDFYGRLQYRINTALAKIEQTHLPRSLASGFQLSLRRATQYIKAHMQQRTLQNQWLRAFYLVFSLLAGLDAAEPLSHTSTLSYLRIQAAFFGRLRATPKPEETRWQRLLRYPQRDGLIVVFFCQTFLRSADEILFMPLRLLITQLLNAGHALLYREPTQEPKKNQPALIAPSLPQLYLRRISSLCVLAITVPIVTTTFTLHGTLYLADNWVVRPLVTPLLALLLALPTASLLVIQQKIWHRKPQPAKVSIAHSSPATETTHAPAPKVSFQQTNDLRNQTEYRLYRPH